MPKRFAAVLAALVISVGVTAAVATAGTPTPAPTTHGGAKASLYATGFDNPTSFAWLNGTMFAGDSGNSNTLPNGGVYVVKHHVGMKISPADVVFVAGLAVHNHVLYVSAAVFHPPATFLAQILAWSGWNGTTFTHQKAIYTAPSGFQGFNGLAFGANGRLYVGVDTGLLNGNDHGPSSTSPYVYDILSMNTAGKKVKVFARGIRQPWQLAFPAKSNNPFVSDLGQDCADTNPCTPTSMPVNPKDLILHVKRGQSYGFPACNYLPSGSNCKGAAKPFKKLAPHTDPMGMAVMGTKLYFGSFLGPNASQGGALYWMHTTGGKVHPVVTMFPLATDALAGHAGKLYVGGQTRLGTGEIYQVTP